MKQAQGIYRSSLAMGSTKILGLLVSLAVLGGFVVPGKASAAGCSDSWTGPAEGSWTTASNWSTGKVPTESDVACIGPGKSVTVGSGTNKAGVVQGEGTLVISTTLELLEPTITSWIGTLKMAGGTVKGSGILEISESLLVEKSSTMSGAGTTLIPAASSGTLQNSLALSGRNLVVRGHWVMPGSGSVEGTGEFVNEGTVRKAGSASASIAPSFRNLGTVKVEEGFLGVTGGSSSSSSRWEVAGGAHLGFGVYTMQGTLTGKVSVGSGPSNVVTMEGVKGAAAQVEVANYSELVFAGSPTTLGILSTGREGYNSASARIAGAGEVRIAEALELAFRATMSGTGMTTLLPGAIGTAAAPITLSRRLVNEGTWLAGPGPLEGAGELVNEGTVRKVGSAYALIATNFDNLGTVKVEEGSLGVGNGSSSSSSRWEVASGARLVFGGSSVFAMRGTLTGKLVASGTTTDLTMEGVEGAAAQVEVAYFGRLNFAGSPTTLRTLATGEAGYNHASSHIEGPGEVKIAEALELAYPATMSGTGTTTLLPGAVGNASASITFGRRLVNEGTWLPGPGTLEGAGEFVNEGTVRKIGTAGALVAANFRNLGTVNVEQGSLSVGSGSSSSSSRWEVAGGADLSFGGVYTMQGTLAGKVSVGSGPSNVVTMEGVKGAAAQVEVANYSGLVFSGSPTNLGTLSTGREGYNAGRPRIEGAGEVRIADTLELGYQARMSGTGTTTLLPGATGTVSGTITLQGRSILNEGTLKLGEAGNLEITSPLEISNVGTFVADNTSGSAVTGTEASRFVNAGIVKKTTGTNTTTISPGFRNLGIIKQESGHISILHPVTAGSLEKFGNHSECGDPVDCATGLFTESQNDLEIGGLGVGLHLTRSYNAQSAAAGSFGIFGYGWTNSFGDHLTSEEGGAKETLTDASGETIPFTKTGVSFLAPPWSQDVLTGDSESGFVLTSPDQTKESFSGAGRLVSVVDRNGNETTLDYNGSGRLEAITDPAGRKISLVYNAEGLVEKAVDPMGHEVRYAYEGKALKSVTMPGEVSPNWQFKYDSLHRMTSMTDGRGGKTTNEYDGSNRVVSQTDPAGRTTTWKYEAFHTTITDKATGAVTDEWFNSNNQPYSITRGLGTAAATTETFTYTATGRLASRTDGNGDTTSYGYDAEGNRTSERSAEGDETTWTFNEAHQVLSETKPNGEKTTITRNANGGPETVSRPAPESKTQTVSYEYGPHGEVKTMTNPLGHAWSYEYDSNGDLKAETDPEGDKRTWAFNEDSQVTSTVSPRGNEEGAEAAKFTTTIERDAQGRPIKITDPLGGTTKRAYDADGNVESITDPNGGKTKFTYDADNECTKVERPNGAIEETGYDGAGQVTGQVDGNKQKTTYVRNVLEQPVEVIDPMERRTTRTFDAAGNLLTKTDPDGRTTTYSYDKADRLKEIAYSAEPGQDVILSYDEEGNLTGMVDGTGKSSYEFDQLGRLIHTEDGNGETVGWEWNLGSEPVGLTYPNGKSISRAYDKTGRLESVTDWLGHTTSFTYNRDSGPTATTFPVGTGDTDEYSWDRADRMSGVTMKKGAETLASLAYSRDPAGQLESLISNGLPGAEEESFSYDENERLSKAGAAEFGYDAANNVTKAPGTTNAYDKASQIESATGASFAFDKEGERTKETPSSGPATTYKYGQAGELAAVERAEEGESPAVAESFGYDGSGRLASRTAGLTTTHFVWDLTESPELLLSDGAESYIYGPGGLPVEAISSEEAPIYLHHDQLGSTRLLTNSSGEVAGTATYGPYGRLSGHTGTATTALGYSGQYTLGQSGLMYLRARYYDPATGQFMTPDPVAPLTRAPYGYASGNPVGNVDPSGYCGVESVGSFLESINPVSSENCAFQAAESLHSATGIDLPGTLSQPAVVDATAVGICVLPGTDVACGAGLVAAFGAATAGVVAEGTETNFCDIPHLVAEEGVNAVLLGFGGLGLETANLAGDAPLAAQGIIRGGPAVAQAVLDWAHGW